MNKLFILLVTFFWMISCSDKEFKDGVEILNCPKKGSWEDKNIKFKVKEVLEITDNLNNDFVFPAYYQLKDIVTNSTGDIYITNNEDKFIYKFSADGKLLNKIGREGKGPGEFLYLSTISIDENDNLYTIDARQKRLIIFNNQDVADKQLVIKSIPNSIGGKVHLVPSEEEMLLYGYSDDPNAIITIIDYDGNICGSIGKYDVVNDEEFEIETSAYNGGSIIQLKDKLLYVNKYYNNLIYLYKQQNLHTIIKTRTFKDIPYTVKKINPDEQKVKWKSGKYNFSHNLNGEKCYMGFKNYTSLNIFILKNGTILHLIEDNKEEEIGFELFDENFQFLGYFTFIGKEMDNYKYQILYKDCEDYFYGKKINKNDGICSIIKFKLEKVSG